MNLDRQGDGPFGEPGAAADDLIAGVPDALFSLSLCLCGLTLRQLYFRSSIIAAKRSNR